MKISLLICLLFLACNRTEPESVLARVGERMITVDEFMLRAELSPEVNFRGPDSARAAGLLDLLISEKLAALAAEDAGMDTLAAIRQLGGFIEDMALARELYRREVQSKVTVKAEELDRAVGYQAQTRIIAYLVFNDELSARRYQERLAAGCSFNQALRDLYGAAADTMANRREIKWGENVSAIEESAFVLNPGQVSPVLAVEGAFMVMVLEEIQRDLVVTEAEQARRRHLARRILRARQEATVSDHYIAALAKEKNLQFNKPLLQKTADFMAEHSMAAQPDDRPFMPGGRPLEVEALQAARLALQSHLETPLVSWRDGHITLRQMLEKWRGYNLAVDQSSAAARRRSIVRGFSLVARDVLLAGEGRRRGYDKLPPVRNDVIMWRDYYLCSALQGHLLEKNAAPNFSWQPHLLQWRARYPVHVDTNRLQRTELTQVPVLALRIGQYNALVVPPWTNFQ